MPFRLDADGYPPTGQFLKTEVEPGSTRRRREAFVRTQSDLESTAVLPTGFVEDDWFVGDREENL